MEETLKTCEYCGMICQRVFMLSDIVCRVDKAAAERVQRILKTLRRNGERV